jgi:predicted Zn-dependent protease
LWEKGLGDEGKRFVSQSAGVLSWVHAPFCSTTKVQNRNHSRWNFLRRKSIMQTTVRFGGEYSMKKMGGSWMAWGGSVPLWLLILATAARAEVPIQGVNSQEAIALSSPLLSSSSHGQPAPDTLRSVDAVSLGNDVSLPESLSFQLETSAIDNSWAIAPLTTTDTEINPATIQPFSPTTFSTTSENGLFPLVARGDRAESSADEATDEPSESPADEATDEASDKPPKPDWIVADSVPSETNALLIEGDRLYEAGQIAEAEERYRQAKGEWETQEEGSDRPNAITDPALLSPAGQVYWSEVQAGLDLGLETHVRVPLQLLLEEYPEFTPAQVLYAQLLLEDDQTEEALASLEQATSRYPHDLGLAQARVATLVQAEEWLDASLAARQYAVLNPDDPASPEMLAIADENLERFRTRLRNRIRGNAIANIVTGALSYALTGGLFGPISALDTTLLMLRGESAVGEAVSERAQEELPLVQDEIIVNYVNELGQRLAALAGRDEFTYEFYVIEDDSLNAFALPGGKVFVNTGAILQTNSEAELAGLLSHEIAHAVLSHGFQLVTSGNLTANLLQFVPYGGWATNLLVFGYSRDMERQADELGTRLLAASGYAADGLYNLMETLDEVGGDRPLFEWLSTHPDTDERIQNLRTQIQENGYNRYAYEGIEQHHEIQRRISQLLGGAIVDPQVFAGRTKLPSDP